MPLNNFTITGQYGKLLPHNLAVKKLPCREVDDDRDRIINLGFLRRKPK